jgi:hypothetical protein
MGACNATKKNHITVNKNNNQAEEREVINPSKSSNKPRGSTNTPLTTNSGVQGNNNQQINPENNKQENQNNQQGKNINEGNASNNQAQLAGTTKEQNPESNNQKTQINNPIVIADVLESDKYYLKIKSENKEIKSSPFPGKKLLISAFDEMKQYLEAADNYHYYTFDKKQNRIYLNELSDKNIEEVFSIENRGQYINIEASNQIYLDLPDDIRSAYSNSTQIIGSPKYGDPFEVVTYDFSSKKFSGQQYETESFKILQSFSEFSGQCNGNNKLYIAGSDKKSEDEYSHFVELDLLNLDKPDLIRICPNLIKGREWCSLLFIPPKYVFIVGGIGVKSVEIFNTENGIIVNDSMLNQEHSESALIVVNNTYLYVFCGYDFNHDYSKVIERCDLRSKKRVWEVVNFSENVSFKPSFFSVAYGKGNSI